MLSRAEASVALKYLVGDVLLTGCGITEFLLFLIGATNSQQHAVNSSLSHAIEKAGYASRRKA